MKFKYLYLISTIPILALATVAFHPGIAYASRASQGGSTELGKIGGSYTIDPMHTSIGFEISHLGLSRVQGRFEKVSGHIVADPKSVANSKVNFTIQADSVNTSVLPRDADLKSPNFFDVATFPEINFASTQIRKKGSGFLVTGDLTMHGVTKPVTIPFKQYGPIKDPWGGTRAGIVAEPIVIDREAYGMHFDVPMVGSKVTVKISLEGTLDKPGTR